MVAFISIAQLYSLRMVCVPWCNLSVSEGFLLQGTYNVTSIWLHASETYPCRFFSDLTSGIRSTSPITILKLKRMWHLKKAMNFHLSMADPVIGSGMLLGLEPTASDETLQQEVLTIQPSPGSCPGYGRVSLLRCLAMIPRKPFVFPSSDRLTTRTHSRPLVPPIPFVLQIRISPYRFVSFLLYLNAKPALQQVF